MKRIIVFTISLMLLFSVNLLAFNDFDNEIVIKPTIVKSDLLIPLENNHELLVIKGVINLAQPDVMIIRKLSSRDKLIVNATLRDRGIQYANQSNRIRDGNTYKLVNLSKLSVFAEKRSCLIRDGTFEMMEKQYVNSK